MEMWKSGYWAGIGSFACGEIGQCASPGRSDDPPSRVLALEQRFVFNWSDGSSSCHLFIFFFCTWLFRGIRWRFPWWFGKVTRLFSDVDGEGGRSGFSFR